MFKIEKVRLMIPGRVSRQPLLFRYEIPLYKFRWKKAVANMDEGFKLEKAPKAFGEQRFGYPSSADEELLRLEGMFGEDDFMKVYPGDTFRREFELCVEMDGVKGFKPKSNNHTQFTNDDDSAELEIEKISCIDHNLAKSLVGDMIDTMEKLAAADPDILMRHGDISMSVVMQIRQEAEEFCKAAAAS